MNKYSLVALSVLGGVLSGLAWTSWCSGLILLFSFVPFIYIWNYLFEKRAKFTQNATFLFLLPGFVIFSIITMGWVRVASMAGALSIVLGLSFLMSFSFWLAHIIRVKEGNIAGFVSVFAFWLSYEFLSLNISIISPWMNLGNGLSKDIALIQWYEVTGTGGGTLWILTSNLLLTLFIINFRKGKKNYLIYPALWLIVIIVPSAISVSRFNSVKESGSAAEEVVIVQPNIDPYSEKFIIPFETQLKKTIDLAGLSISSETDWVITPETTVDDPVNLDGLNNDKYMSMIRNLVRKFPRSSVVAGLVSYRIYPFSDKPPTISARMKDNSDLYFDHFNSAFRIDTGKTIEVYHKSRLVPGIEMQFRTGRLIAKFLPRLGGTMWGYGIQESRESFTNNQTKTRTATIICYESIFGEYVTDYVKAGANSLFMITNDGWWKGTKGYNQHLSFASLRAIETRRPVARAANTGISCIIDIKGKRIAETEWWEESVLKGEIIPETRITPYVKHGDYLLRIGTLISVFVLLVTFIALPLRRKMRTFR